MVITNANMINSEYLTTTRNTEVDFDQGSESISSMSSRPRFQRFLSFGHLLNDNSKLYKTWNYISSVHIASLSAIMYSMFIVMVMWNSTTLITMRIITAILDVYFLIRIYVGAHLSYKDPESGIVVKDLKSIRRRYFCSLTKFWLDLITTCPFEYIVCIFTSDVNITKYGYSVRVLRCFFLYKYYREQEDNLNVREHLRLTYLIYKIGLSIEWTTCLW